ncbi:uncharacterized protein EV154DRAFT_327817 [Mucor mucedo]|uniref:uncharacterized protein n=1 Tax=Mucor mucedo TaxID=29922 RepID=UPI0022208A6E|nr:uncharacterized protein EV154DRAFT_327817 [Mucor mucedo]KAI7887827.1 hypothetical protein EV154DRAFT_327817 [Mucor mucedo]
MTSTLQQQTPVFPMSDKTEQNPGLITPPMSPIDTTSRPVTNKSSLKITAGQTGLPWLTHDADGDHFSPIIQQSPEENTAITSPPPKFLAHPKATSIIRFPTRRRTMQKYIYTMKDGLDPVKVLCDRLMSWQISVKYLNSMFQSIKKVEFSTGKGYRKIDAKFAIPSKIENQFKSSDGVKDAWHAFRQYTRENSLIHQDFVDYIENEILPILHIMLRDIHLHMQGMKHNKQLYTNSLWDCRKQADSVITRLNTDIYATVNIQEKQKSPYVTPKRDPLLTKQVVINTIQKLYKQENRLHKEFLDTQDKYRQFEQEKIINVYTDLFQTFENYRVRHGLENLEGVLKVASIFNAIETDAEWLDFLHHHENDLVKRSAAFKDEVTLDFPNVGHPLVQPAMMGNLQRSHGKKWIEEYYVLSSVGLLHRYKSKNEYLQAPLKPQVTMFIPQCTILVNPTSHLLELRGKTTGGLFGSKKFFALSSEDPNALRLWIDILDRMALQKPIPIMPRQAPVTATTVDTRSIHSKVLAEDEVPMQPIVQGTSSQHMIAPITNTASHLVYHDDDNDDEDDFRNQTIEYSTHSPIGETPPAVVPPHGPDGNLLKTPPGITREGSDLFWDTATTNLDK